MECFGFFLLVYGWELGPSDVCEQNREHNIIEDLISSKKVVAELSYLWIFVIANSVKNPFICINIK